MVQCYETGTGPEGGGPTSLAAKSATSGSISDCRRLEPRRTPRRRRAECVVNAKQRQVHPANRHRRNHLREAEPASLAATAQAFPCVRTPGRSRRQPLLRTVGERAFREDRRYIFIAMNGPHIIARPTSTPSAQSEATEPTRTPPSTE
jgi:hypothetical protein